MLSCSLFDQERPFPVFSIFPLAIRKLLLLIRMVPL